MGKRKYAKTLKNAIIKLESSERNPNSLKNYFQEEISPLEKGVTN